MDAETRLGRASIARGSESFASAARLFPAATRNSAVMLYAACRYCDDVIDGQSLGFPDATPDDATPAQRLHRLSDGLQRALRGEPTEQTVFRAFQRVVDDNDIPEPYVMDLLEGFRMDVHAHRYDEIDDTLRYAYHVAGVVGVMMSLIMGVRRDDTLDRACDLGIALQLTNMARDVLEDAAMGRCYLPARWLAEESVPETALADRRHRERLTRVAGRLLNCAEPYYASATAGLSALSFRHGWAVAAAQSVYREIGLEVRRRGAAAWDTRVFTSRRRKLALILLASGRAAHAVTLGRLLTPDDRSGLWTRPRYQAG